MAGERNYRLLWLAVIYNATEEAAGRNLVGSGGHSRNTVEQAMRWLTHASPGLRRACEFAGVEMDKVIRRYSKMYSKKGE